MQNPILKLRVQLGSPLRPYSSPKLARLLSIPAATLRSVELGRRPLNPELLKRIEFAGALWMPDLGEWRFTYHPLVPVTLILLEYLDRFGTGSPWFRDRDLRALCLRLITLLQHVPRKRYNHLLLLAHRTFKNWVTDFEVVDSDDIFGKTEIEYFLTENESGGQTMGKGYHDLRVPDLNAILNFSEYSEMKRKIEAESQEINPSDPLTGIERSPEKREKNILAGKEDT